eukprot:1131134-Rhodomonas_salina.1
MRAPPSVPSIRARQLEQWSDEANPRAIGRDVSILPLLNPKWIRDTLKPLHHSLNHSLFVLK